MKTKVLSPLFPLALLIFCCGNILFSQNNPDLEKGIQLYREKNFSGAIKSLNKALAANADCENCYVYKVISCLNNQQFQEAYNTMVTGIKKFPANAELYYYRGTLIHNTGDMYGAMDDANMAVKYAKADTTLLNAYLLRVGVKVGLRNFDGAIDDCKLILAKDSLHQGALTNLSLTYSEINQVDTAIYLMKKVIRLDSSFVQGVANLGYLLNLKGDYETAKKYLDMGLRSKNKASKPYMLSNRAYAEMKLGDMKSAMKDINESIALMPDNSYAYRNLGLIYLEKKEKDKACEAFNKALQKGFTETYGEEMKTLIKQNCTTE